VLTVGLTGGIGSGKSAAAQRLAALGAVVVDSDAIAREVVAPGTDGLQAVVEAFGPDILMSDGSLDRDRLGARVFADPDALSRLNAIVHPRVRERTAARFAAAEAADPQAIVVNDVPLLVEGALQSLYEVVVVVDVPVETQVERLITKRGISEANARARIAAQASREQRLAAANLVIDNRGGFDDLDREVARVWADLSGRSSGGLGR
jgi:dephospho-CoA kinase